MATIQMILISKLRYQKEFFVTAIVFVKNFNATLKFSKTQRFATLFLQRNHALYAPLNMYETSIRFDQCICDYL